MLFTSALFVDTLIFLQSSVDKTKGCHILYKSNEDSLWGLGDLSLSETSDYSRSSFVMLPKCSGKLAKKEYICFGIPSHPASNFKLIVIDCLSYNK